MLLSFSQDKTSFQNSEDTLQREGKCLMDSGSSLQNVQLGDCERPKRNNLSFVKTMLFTYDKFIYSMQLASQQAGSNNRPQKMATSAGFELAHSKTTQHWTSPCERPPTAHARDPTPTGQRSACPKPHSILMTSSFERWVFSIQNAIPTPLTTAIEK